jgi:general secretion pathway protein D
MYIRVLCAAGLLASLPLLSSAADGSSPDAAGESRQQGGPYVDITSLITRVAKQTGKQFVLDPRLRAEVPVGTLDLDRVDYARLLTILRVNGFSAFEAEGVVIVVPDANSRQMATPVITTISAKTPDSELVTVLMHAKNVCAAQTVPVLRPLMPQAAHLAAMPQTNSLLLVDTAANARRIADLFGRLDKQAAALELTCAEWRAPDPKAGS